MGANPYTVLRILVFAFAAQTVLLNVFVAPGLLRADRPNIAFVVVGMVSILVGVMFSQSWLSPIAQLDGALPPPAQYQVKMLVPLAFMEFGALIGIFTVGHALTSYVISGVSLAGMVLLVYPNVERYCRAATERGTK